MTWQYLITQLIAGAIVFVVSTGILIALAPWIIKKMERDLEKIARKKEKEFAEWLYRNH